MEAFFFPRLPSSPPPGVFHLMLQPDPPLFSTPRDRLTRPGTGRVSYANGRLQTLFYVICIVTFRKFYILHGSNIKLRNKLFKLSFITERNKLWHKEQISWTLVLFISMRDIAFTFNHSWADTSQQLTYTGVVSMLRTAIYRGKHSGH